jgi:hypothetical protein
VKEPEKTRMASHGKTTPRHRLLLLNVAAGPHQLLYSGPVDQMLLPNAPVGVARNLHMFRSGEVEAYDRCAAVTREVDATFSS